MNTELQILILHRSIEIEEITSEYLASHFHITNWQQTKSFGTSTQAMGLNQKINLLEDIVGKEKISKNLFEGFMVIRNKFVHLSIYSELQELARHNDQIKKAFKELGYTKIESEIDTLKAYDILFATLKTQLYELSKITTKNAINILTQVATKAILEEREKQIREIENYIRDSEHIKKEEIVKILNRTLI